MSNNIIKDINMDGGGVDAVISHGYCIGCGTCTVINNSPYEMFFNEFGQWQARLRGGFEKALSPDISNDVASVCPFSNQAVNENVLGQDLFQKSDKYHPKIGYWIAAYAGFVNYGDYRQQGSSGGMGTWLADALLMEGLADAVVHVQSAHAANGVPLFDYRISRQRGDLAKGSKSKYYPVTLAEVLKIVRDQPGRYIFVGVPCFIKAVRLLARQDPMILKSVAYCIGLVCGHLKSHAFTECIAWQVGIKPSDVCDIDFRKKLHSKSANKYGVKIVGTIAGRLVTRISPVHKLFGCDWGMGLFKPLACDYCDDVVAETADVTIGDAWLPKYVNDSKGTNIIIVRNPDIEQLLQQGRRTSALNLDYLSPEDIVTSQQAGFSHRHEGLAYRLYLSDLDGRWRPVKRIQAKASEFGSVLSRRQLLRVKLASISHEIFLEAKRQNNLKYFLDRLLPLADQYLNLTRTPVKRILARLRNALLRIIN